MMRKQDEYIAGLQQCFAVLENQSDTIESVCKGVYESLKTGGILHVFGSGHSHSFGEELFHRAGGLVPVNAVLEDMLMPHAGPTQVGPLERLPGLAEIIWKKYSFVAGEFVLIASNSGINAVAVEFAMKAKKEGLKTVAVTSLSHSKGVPARTTKKLFEVCDYIIDTGTPVGDACVQIDKSDVKVAPLSGVVSLLVGELIVAGVAQMFSDNGLVPPVYQSANTPGGDERNKKLEDQYRGRIRHLR